MNVTFLELALLVVVALTIGTAVFWRLWNDTVPDVFNVNRITFWQALRLLIIAAIVLNLGIG